jgi:hypothetical protein
MAPMPPPSSIGAEAAERFVTKGGDVAEAEAALEEKSAPSGPSGTTRNDWVVPDDGEAVLMAEGHSLIRSSLVALKANQLARRPNLICLPSA